MGSSYRSDLNSGFGCEAWEKKLRDAIALIREVALDVSDCIGSDGQYDNAADDGALQGKLYDAINLIESELPKRNADGSIKKWVACQTCNQWHWE